MQKEIEAVKTLLRFIGEDPDREGLKETPARFLRAWRDEFFKGYEIDPKAFLETTFSETDTYSKMILLKDITFTSYCEHHIVPIIGKAHIGYIPNGEVVGISKIVRVLQGYAQRLQIQERLTEQVAQTLFEGLNAKGVIVLIEAEHYCMRTRGVKTNSTMSTMSIKGTVNQEEFFHAIRR